MFTAWWLYFAVLIHEYFLSNRQGFMWGYGHFPVLASVAAIGAGTGVAVEQAVGESHFSDRAAVAAVTVPAAVFLLVVRLLHSRHFKRTVAQQLTMPTGAFAILLCTISGPPGSRSGSAPE